MLRYQKITDLSGRPVGIEVFSGFSDGSEDLEVLKTVSSLKSDIPVFVNIHPDNLSVLSELEVKSHIVLEITEMDGDHAFIQKLRERGWKIAIDDFGKGFSNYLRLMSGVDYLKVAGEIIREVHRKEVRAILENILCLSESLGSQVIAEWVETEETFEALKALGFKLFQGFYFHRPEVLKYPLCQEERVISENGEVYGILSSLIREDGIITE